MKMVVKNKASGLKMEINRTGGGTIPDGLESGASDDRILSVIGKVCFEGVESGMDLNEILLKRMSGKRPSTYIHINFIKLFATSS